MITQEQIDQKVIQTVQGMTCSITQVTAQWGIELTERERVLCTVLTSTFATYLVNAIAELVVVDKEKVS